MPSAPGLALIGFMSEQQACHYLAQECECANTDPAALIAEWIAAQARQGEAQANCGQPQIRDVPEDHQGHIQQVVNSPDWQPIFANNPNWQIKLVEAAPLLAYQFSVLDGAATNHSTGFSAPPTLAELLNVCLPIAPTVDDYSVVQQPNSVLIRSRSLNVRPLHFGMVQPGCFMLQVGVSLPFVHVVRYNGRCYLHNGYHRAYAAMMAGATEIPCVFRDVATEAEIGLNPGTFDLGTLESANAPTLNHFAGGQAHPVNLIIKTRVMHLNWTDWIAPEI